MKKNFAKILCALLCVVMVFSMASCAKEEPKETPNIEPVGDPIVLTPEEDEDEQEILTDYVVEFGEGLPSWTLPGDYVVKEIPEYLADIGMYESYSPVNEGGYSLGLYRYPKDGMTIAEAIAKDIATYVPEGETVASGEFDEWNEPGDYHYGYYMWFDSKSFERPLYFQEFFFEDGEEIVNVEYVIPANEVAIGDTGAYMEIPVSMVEYELSERSVGIDGVFGYTHKDNEFANIEAYVWDTKATTGEELLAETKENYPYDFEELSSGTYDFVGADGNNYSGCYMKFNETIDGVKCIQTSVLAVVGDKAVCGNFSMTEENFDYESISIPALTWGIDINVQ